MLYAVHTRRAEKVKDTTLYRSDSQSSLLSLGSISSLSSLSAKKLNVKLPKLELRKLSGKNHEWQEFWDGFCSAIHENEDLAGTEKFNFFRGSRKGGYCRHANDRQGISVAVELLKKRYAKPSMIQRAHMNELIMIKKYYADTAREEILGIGLNHICIIGSNFGK